MNEAAKTHFRKAFNSPYLSSADIVGPTTLTIARVALESDKTKKTKDLFNTAYFVERELRPGEKLKPMILNATNSKTLSVLAGSAFIDDWTGIKVTIYVDKNVKYGKEIMEGLRISPMAPIEVWLTPDVAKAWSNAKAAYRRDGNLDAVLSRMQISDAHQQQIMEECANESSVA
jgi:hypothetical protein